jgi:mannan endo-1,4-beta-mannosidase
MAQGSGLNGYITRSGDRLVDGDREFRFISFNVPCLHYIEDALAFDETNPWRLPDTWEIEDAIESVRQMGGTVIRTYALSVRKADDEETVPRHVLAAGRFDEDAFRILDRVIGTADRLGIRLIIPFVDNWSWWGGTAEYAAFRGKNREAFWTDGRVREDFKETIRFVLNRRNTMTGALYRDEKAVLAWETGNELQSPPEWTSDITAFIRSLDRNHLIMDGFHSSVLRRESLDDPNTDIVTTHHYPRSGDVMIREAVENRSQAEGKKPYVIGEFGFVPTGGISAFLDTVIGSGISGALIWSLRAHNRDGGFYWHTEPYGGNRYKAYHWPGFESGAEYDETALLSLMRRKAFEIRGLAEPPLPAPSAPILLPVSEPGAVSWLGSAGAAFYDVERAPSENGPWTVIGRNVSDAAAAYRPLFSDTGAAIGAPAWYRIRARNVSGGSAPSNAAACPPVTHLSLVDEMENLDRAASHAGGLSIETGNSRKAKEDFHRVRGASGAVLVYRTPGAMAGWKIDAFFPDAISDFTISESTDGLTFSGRTPGKTEMFRGRREYGYWKPVRYASTALSGSRWLKIEFTGEAQLGRVEIRYGR